MKYSRPGRRSAGVGGQALSRIRPLFTHYARIPEKGPIEEIIEMMQNVWG